MRAYYSACRFLARASLGFLSGMEVRGQSNIPRHGGLLLASNHVSFWDPPMVGSTIPREVHFLAKDALFDTPGLGSLIRSLNAIPIRRGVADLSGMSRAVGVLKAGGALLIFPEGSRMRDGELHAARPGVGLLAVQSDVPVVPCSIVGSGRPRLWMTRRVHVRIWFGPPRTWRELAGPDVDPMPGRALYQRVGDGIMREIAALRSGQNQTASRGAA